MKQPPTNIAASVLARLKNIADREELDFNVLLVRYVQERFLSRLASSEYGKNLVLKGGFLLLAYNVARARPTRDIDFLGLDISSDRMDVERVVRDIISVAQNDGVSFLPESVKSQSIKEEARYQGVRVKLNAKIGSARIMLQTDFGFGDIVSPYPVQLDYPTILDGKPLQVLAYSKESIIAEKFEALVQLGVFNTRMKDFYDIVFLASEFEFVESELREAIWRTFERRHTSLRKARDFFDAGIAPEASLVLQWEAFRKRSQLLPELDFQYVVENLRELLYPLLDDETRYDSIRRIWNKKSSRWLREGG